MKLGYFVGNQYLASESAAARIQENLVQVATARDAGFDLICAGQHYLSDPYQMPATFPLLARLASEAGDMHLAATVILVPLHNPVDLAESVATMDAATGGRFIFGIGLGYREEEYTAFGIKREERVPRMLESLEIMRGLWTQDRMEYEGRFYRVPSVTPSFPPTQKPHPPIWMAANHDKAVMRAAELGYPWLVNPHATVTMVDQQLARYREVASSTSGPDGTQVPMMREAYVAATREQAMAEAEPYLGPKYRAYAQWGQDKALPGNESFHVPFEDLARDRFIIGTPDDIVSELRHYEENLGVSHMILRMQWPGMEHGRGLKQLETMGRDVIPRLKSS